MSGVWQRAELLEPISAEHPCGQNLEDSALLASFDAYRLYGRTKPLEPATDTGSGSPKTVEDRDERPPDWGEIKEKSLEALQQSKDLRLLAHLGAALLRTDGLPAFTETIRIASHWLEAFWDQTYPLVDGDGIVRRSALNCFADPIAVVDRLRRVAIVSSRQHGTFSLRDIDVATGQVAPSKGETRPDEAQINAAFAALSVEDLSELLQGVAGAAQALKDIDGKMRREVATEAAPEFEPLSAQLVKIDKVLRAQLAARPGANVGASDSGAAVVGGPAFSVAGELRSREEAIRALDAVAEYFRKHEPSSPVPLFCDRAKRLVACDFLAVLENIAPDAVKQARAAGGLKD